MLRSCNNPACVRQASADGKCGPEAPRLPLSADGEDEWESMNEDDEEEEEEEEEDEEN
jgi:hypothetical protein